MNNLTYYIAGAYFAMYALALLWSIACRVIGAFCASVRARRHVINPPPCEPSIVVTLVHGTWARHALWTAPESLLCQCLSHAVESTISFQRFVWSGGNSISARRRAVKQLVEHLHSVVYQFPLARHYIIAHSHGGNVAFQALADPMLNERIAGLVCLSTPFLTVEPRNLGPLGHTVLGWFPGIAIFMGGCVIFGLFGQLNAVNNGLLDFIGILLVCVFAIAGGILGPRLLNRFSMSVVDSLQYPSVDPSRLLILRAAGDEAAAILGLTHVISWAAGRFWLVTSYSLDQAVKRVELWRESLIRHWHLTALATVCSLALCVAAAENWLPEEFFFGLLPPLLIFSILVKGGFTSMFISRALLSLIAAPFLVVIAFLGIAVGPELLVASLLFQVTGEPAPPGRWVVWQIAPQNDRSDTIGEMMHSESYQNPQALAILGTWFATAEGELAGKTLPSNNALHKTVADAPADER